MPWAAGGGVCMSVCVSVRAESFMGDPDTSKDLAVENRGSSFNYAEK